MSVPDGFEPLFRTSPVLDLIGPLYSHGKGPGLSLGLRVAEKHCNSRGTVHGGILATLADVALGYTLAFATDPPAKGTTVSLSIDYAGTAKIGDWIDTTVDFQKQGSRLSFANAYIHCGSQRIARASAIFFIAAERPGGALSE